MSVPFFDINVAGGAWAMEEGAFSSLSERLRKPQALQAVRPDRATGAGGALAGDASIWKPTSGWCAGALSPSAPSSVSPTDYETSVVKRADAHGCADGSAGP